MNNTMPDWGQNDSLVLDQKQVAKNKIDTPMPISFNGISSDLDSFVTKALEDDKTLYVVGLPVCSECAKGIIQTGIKHVIMSIEEDYKVTDRWMQSFEITKEMFDEAVEHLKREHDKKDRTFVLYYKGYLIRGPLLEVTKVIGKELNAKN